MLFPSFSICQSANKAKFSIKKDQTAFTQIFMTAITFRMELQEFVNAYTWSQKLGQ